MTDELEQSRLEVGYLINKIYSNSEKVKWEILDVTDSYFTAEYRKKKTHSVGVKIHQLAQNIKKLQDEWIRFLELKKNKEKIF